MIKIVTVGYGNSVRIKVLIIFGIRVYKKVCIPTGDYLDDSEIEKEMLTIL